MKILFVITKSNFGGAQRYVFELATRLKADGSEVAVALGGEGALKTKLEAAGIQVFQISGAQRDISMTKEIRALFSLMSIFRTFKPDAVHLNSPKMGALGALTARLSGVRNIVYTNHGWPFKESRPEWQLVIIRLLSWLTVFIGGRTIVLSQTEKDDVRGWPFIQKKLVVIPNGIAEFPLLAREEALKKLLGEDRLAKLDSSAEKVTVIGTISELHKNKGLTYALEGIKGYVDQYPASKLLFIVMGEGEQRKELEEMITTKNLRENVVLAGHVDEARSYLKAFDLFLLSSIKEGLPFALLEAGFAEVPIITTSVGGIPELISNLKEGLVIPPRRPQEIQNGIVYALEHQKEEKAMVKNFKKKIETKYSFETILKKLKELYFIS
ncbi:MAG TPA: glycosyltransferase [Candidatus Paceibacterota bacterium]